MSRMIDNALTIGPQSYEEAIKVITDASFTGGDGLDYVETLVALNALKSVNRKHEIIRCKDCIYACDYTDIYDDPIAYKCVKNGGHHMGDWYCADAERREDG